MNVPPNKYNEMDAISDVSEVSGPFFAVWGSLNPDHQAITSSMSQAYMFAKLFSSMNVPLTHISEHSSRISADMFLSTQSPDMAQNFLSNPTDYPRIIFYSQLQREKEFKKPTRN